MIAYLPFTYISEAHIDVLTGLIGPLAIHQVLDNPLPEHMQAKIEQRLLQLHRPAQVDLGQIKHLMGEYGQWADVYQGKVQDLAGFLHSIQDNPPMVSETSPNVIRTQIQRYGQDQRQDKSNPVLQATLFLALAHELDRCQHNVDQELASAHIVETQLYTQMTGGDPQTVRSSDFFFQSQDPGLHMTAQRLKAWAILALSSQFVPLIYFTTSRAVFDYLLDYEPQAKELFQKHYKPLTGEKCPSHYQAADQRREILIQLTSEDDPSTIPLDAFEIAPPTSLSTPMRLVVYRVADRQPHDFLNNLLQQPTGALQPPASQGRSNILFGLVELVQNSGNNPG